MKCKYGTKTGQENGLYDNELKYIQRKGTFNESLIGARRNLSSLVSEALSLQELEVCKMNCQNEKGGYVWTREPLRRWDCFLLSSLCTILWNRAIPNGIRQYNSSCHNEQLVWIFGYSSFQILSIWMIAVKMMCDRVEISLAQKLTFQWKSQQRWAGYVSAQ